MSEERVIGAEIQDIHRDENSKGSSVYVRLLHYLRITAELLVVGVCTLAFAISAVGVGATLLTGSNAGTRDFITYWASSQQLIHHSNPYDEDNLLQLEDSAGFPPGMPFMVMRNPPFALPLIFPLGFFSEKAAAGLWSLLLLGSLVASVRIVWLLNS